VSDFTRSFIRSKIHDLEFGERFYNVFFTVKNPSPKFSWAILQSRLYGQKSLTLIKVSDFTKSFIRSKIHDLEFGERFYKVFFTVKNPSPKFSWAILQSRLNGQKSIN
jgi:hypothetical protein